MEQEHSENNQSEFQPQQFEDSTEAEIQAPNPTQELNCLKNLIAEEFPQLEFYFHSTEMFLSVTKLSYSGLKYLPTFHLIFTFVSKDSFCSRLITYHGRSLDTFIFRCDNKTLPSKVFEVVKSINDDANLCQGVDENVSQNGLIECLNDIIVARHRKCRFLLPYDSQTRTCEKCLTLLTKNIIKSEFQPPLPLPDFQQNMLPEESWESIDTKENIGSCLLVEIGDKRDDNEYVEDQSWEPYNYEDFDILE